MNKDTVWSVIYDLKNKKIYRVEGNPSRKKFIEDKRFKLVGNCSMQLVSFKTDSNLEIDSYLF